MATLKARAAHTKLAKRYAGHLPVVRKSCGVCRARSGSSCVNFKGEAMWSYHYSRISGVKPLREARAR